MRDYKSKLEKHIIEEVHPYKIYDNSKVVKGQWATYIPDPTHPRGRRPFRRKGYDKLVSALIEFYVEKYHFDMTLNELFDRWVMFRRDETAVKTGTIRKDFSLWNTHCHMVEVERKALGDWKVREMTTKLLYIFFRKLTKDREFSKKTVNNIRGVLSGMFSYAVERDFIESNPVRDVDMKRLTYKPIPDKSEDVFTEAEAKKLLSYLKDVKDDPYALAIRLDFNLFARFGEIAGLMWENIDFEKRQIRICHQITYEPDLNDDLTFTEKKQVTEGYLKGYTSQGYRTEYMTDEAMRILMQARDIGESDTYVFFANGRPLINLTFNKKLKKFCEEAGVPYHSSHKIRFYAASTAYNGENLLSISKMMGHSQVSTTLHYLRDVDQDETCADVFSKLGLNDQN